MSVFWEEKQVKGRVWFKEPLFSKEHLIQTVKHSGRRVMIWSRFVASGLSNVPDSEDNELICFQKYFSQM